MKVGFIGLGQMGRPMAANIINAGYEVIVHDLRREAGEFLLDKGATWSDEAQTVAEMASAVITSLPGPTEVELVMQGEHGVLAGLRPGSTWIDVSTSSPALTRRIAALADQKGADTLDAPVTGAVDGAVAGTLTFFVGGDADVFERHRQLLAAMGENIFHCGPLGTGLAAKLLTNLLWFINAVAIGEGMMLGARAGIELQALWQIIKSSAGNSWVAEHDVPSIFRGDYDPSFTLDLCCKDLHLIQSLGRELEVPLELGGRAESIFLQARARYGGDAGEMHVVKLLEDLVGTRLQVPGFS
jgi:3-hydroxyisobutyrate dehydrogenase-like beta-hydroxyacid dehydrogenase